MYKTKKQLVKSTAIIILFSWQTYYYNNLYCALLKLYNNILTMQLMRSIPNTNQYCSFYLNTYNMLVST